MDRRRLAARARRRSLAADAQAARRAARPHGPAAVGRFLRGPDGHPVGLSRAGAGRSATDRIRSRRAETCGQRQLSGRFGAADLHRARPLVRSRSIAPPDRPGRCRAAAVLRPQGVRRTGLRRREAEDIPVRRRTAMGARFPRGEKPAPAGDQLRKHRRLVLFDRRRPELETARHADGSLRHAPQRLRRLPRPQDRALRGRRGRGAPARLPLSRQSAADRREPVAGSRKIAAMLKRFALVLAALLLPAAAAAQATTNVVIETEVGDIVVALETERAPVTAANFLRYADEKRFDGIVFYRAMRLDWGEQPNGLVQAGTQFDPDRILPPIAHEPTNV